jgi:hypothetical protein
VVADENAAAVRDFIERAWNGGDSRSSRSTFLWISRFREAETGSSE